MSYIDEFIKRQMRIARAGDGQAQKTVKKFQTVNSRIRSILLRYKDNEFTPVARQEAKSKIQDILVESFNVAYEDIESETESIITKEETWQKALMGEYAPDSVVLFDRSAAIQAVKGTPYQGRFWGDWFKRAADKSTRKVFSEIDTGYHAGETLQQITKRVEGMMNVPASDLRTLVRSYVMDTAATARSEFIKSNEDLIDERQWNSTLDIRTTADICGIRDKKRYTKDFEPIDHDLDWGDGPGKIHFNCRSIEIPIIKGITQSVERPSVGSGENYERGDKTTRTGRVRKPTKPNREKGIFNVDQVGPRTNYEMWLKRQNTDFVADALGSVEKAKAFKSGTPLLEVTSNPLGTPLSINDL